ncbi:GNAT family N-acetyltransferase [Nonlabens ponticola]|uniref:GNAT family N-acetyltransferase n=1 Tax=Nonlabens ponticola TaxID=2496866 RepID=A0A3S9MYS7_9FLAO|nr:GNAT family N-acetyltransferase [Nonlabens ponticola]AZQ44340.1 GNAT family N-acetyltransferase [Nonlabens ponticola]
MNIVIANESHFKYAYIICETINKSAVERDTGIAKRTPEYITTKMQNGNAVIALDNQKFTGFCYIERWDHGKYVANSGLIVHHDYRGKGYAKLIKKKIFELSREKFPDAKIFGITTGLPVMKINYELGYQPTTFSELTTDDAFWKGCQTCKNFDVLTRTNRKMCLCTGMIYDPARSIPKPEKKVVTKSLHDRLQNIKKSILFKKDPTK